MLEVNSPYFDPDFEKLTERIQGPSCRTCIDNESCENCTVVKVHSVNKQDLLLRVVQVLTDMDLCICKGNISSDAGRWFMDVFHVRDQGGKKLTDNKALDYIQEAIGSKKEVMGSADLKSGCPELSSKQRPPATAIEMTAPDRPGLLSEISAVLTELRCNVVEAHAWSHHHRLACILNISDEHTSSPIEDPQRLAAIEGHLSVLLGAADFDNHHDVRMRFSCRGNDPITSKERRLHQIMSASEDMEAGSDEDEKKKHLVSIQRCNEKGYSVVNVEGQDRPKLLFDIVCTLTDMHYVVFHASIASNGCYASQEYYIRRVDGCTMDSETEMKRVVQQLEAAIERRVSEGVRLEFCTRDRMGLLSEVTRLLREHGLAVMRADVKKEGERSMTAVYVRDICGNAVNMDAVESVKREMEPLFLHVTHETLKTTPNLPHTPPGQSLTHLVKSQIGKFSSNIVSII